MRTNLHKRIMIALLVLLLLTGIVLIMIGVVIPRQKYQKAMGLLSVGEYDEAYAILAELGKDQIINDNLNERADALLEAGDADSAYGLLAGLTDDASLEKCREIKRQQIAETKVGAFFTLGFYEQDDDTKNGSEPIEWKVLAVEGTRVLAISRYVLDCVLYDEEWRDVTWETCTLRTWLNDDFFPSSFTTAEKDLICTAQVSADKNPEYKTDPGNPTEDKIFILSVPEVEQLFPYEAATQCRTTKYARSQGCYVNKETSTASWWLRTPGSFPTCAARVYSFGPIDYLGLIVNCVNVSALPGVRPAIWIDLAE